MLELKATAGRLESGHPLKCLRDEMEIVNAYELVAYTVARLLGEGPKRSTARKVVPIRVSIRAHLVCLEIDGPVRRPRRASAPRALTVKENHP